jgi:hypothetical protein
MPANRNGTIVPAAIIVVAKTNDVGLQGARAISRTGSIPMDRRVI